VITVTPVAKCPIASRSCADETPAGQTPQVTSELAEALGINGYLLRVPLVMSCHVMSCHGPAPGTSRTGQRAATSSLPSPSHPSQ
jgi:hypothetical protein